MLVRVMVLVQLVVLVIAGEVLSDDGRRFRGIATVHLLQEGSDSFKNGADNAGPRRLHRRSTAVPPAPAARRRAALQARDALRRRLALAGGDAETLFASETRNAHAGRLPPPDEETPKPPTSVDKTPSPPGSVGNKTVSRYLQRGRRPSTPSPESGETNDESESIEDEGEAKQRQRKRRPSKEPHSGDSSDDDDNDNDDISDSSSEKSGATKADQKLARKRHPDHESSPDDVKDKEKPEREQRGRRYYTTVGPVATTSEAKSPNDGSTTTESAKVDGESNEDFSNSRVRRPTAIISSTEETIKSSESSVSGETAPPPVVHKRRWPTDAISPPSSHAPFHPMLPAASALTMSDSLYNHFRPLNDVPEDHILPFLSFGKKLAAKTVAAQRPATGSTNSLLPDAGAGSGVVGWSLTTLPPEQSRGHRGSTKHRPLEDEVDEDMDVELARPVVERNKAARGGVTSAALRTLYSSQHRRLENSSSSTESSIRTSAADADHAQNLTEVSTSTPTEENVDDSLKQGVSVLVPSAAPTSTVSSHPNTSATTSSSSSVHTSLAATSRRTTNSPTLSSAKPEDDRDVTSAGSEATQIISNPHTISAHLQTETTSNLTANPSIYEKSTVIVATTSSFKTYSDIITTTTSSTPLLNRPSSRWTIIVTMPPAVEETFSPPPRLKKRPIIVNNLTRFFPKNSTTDASRAPVPTVSYITSSDTITHSAAATAFNETFTASVSATPNTPSTVKSSSANTQATTPTSYSYVSPLKIRTTSTTSAPTIKDPYLQRPRNFSIFSTANRRPFLRKPPPKSVTATSSPNHRNNTEPPQFTNSVYVDIRQPPVVKASNISWFPLFLELPTKNMTKLTMQRPTNKYQRPRNRSLSTSENTLEITDATTASVKGPEYYSAEDSLTVNRTLKSASPINVNSPEESSVDVSSIGLSPPPPTTKILSTAVVTSVSVRGEWRSPASTTLLPSLLPLPLELTADSDTVAEIPAKLNTTEPPQNLVPLSNASSEPTNISRITSQHKVTEPTVAIVRKDAETTIVPVTHTTAFRTTKSTSSSSLLSNSTSTSVDHKNSSTTEMNRNDTELSFGTTQSVSTARNLVNDSKIVKEVSTRPESFSQPVTPPIRASEVSEIVESTSVHDMTMEAATDTVTTTIPTTQKTVEAVQPQATIPLSTDTPPTVRTTPRKAIFGTPDKEDQLPIVDLYNSSSTMWASPSTPQPAADGPATALRPNSSGQPGVQWDSGAPPPPPPPPPACGGHNDSRCLGAGTPASGADSAWGVQAGVYALTALCVVPLAVAAAFGVRYVARRRRKFLDESDTCSEVSCPPRGLISRGDKDIDGDTKASRLQPHMGWDLEGLPATSWEVPRSKLRLQTVLGQGNFGQVLKAEIDDICGGIGSTRLVAVKTVKEEASQRDKDDLLREMEIMKMLGAHPNVVTLLGCCTEQEPHLLIMEYVMYGKLLAYLRDHRTRRKYFNFCEDDSDALTSRDLTVFAYCVARGMEYLAAKGIIHRDLAARNVLVDHNKMCKVADFGMSRSVRDLGDVYEQRHTKGALPIRWMAPESLLYRIFTHKSDVWSFGILIWEIVTLGSTPYPGQSAREVVRLVREGGRLERPPHCRPELFRLASRCWHHDPARRPSFGELKRELAALVEDTRFGGGYVDLDAFADHGYCYGRIPTAVRPSTNTTADTTTTAEECDAEVISM